MGVVGGVIRTSGNAATVATGAAGAFAGVAVGAALGGAVGIVRGGVRGAGAGAGSAPAAALTMAVVGATGIVDWPVVLVVGGAALALRRLRGSAAGPEPRSRRPTPATKPTSNPAGASRVRATN